MFAVAYKEKSSVTLWHAGMFLERTKIIRQEGRVRSEMPYSRASALVRWCEELHQISMIWTIRGNKKHNHRMSEWYELFNFAEFLCHKEDIDCMVWFIPFKDNFVLLTVELIFIRVVSVPQYAFCPKVITKARTVNKFINSAHPCGLYYLFTFL